MPCHFLGPDFDYYLYLETPPCVGDLVVYRARNYKVVRRKWDFDAAPKKIILTLDLE